MINSIDIARKIGFAAALSSGVVSAYNEAAKYSWGDDTKKAMRMRSAFYGAFKEGTKAAVDARRGWERRPYVFLQPEHELLFKK